MCIRDRVGINATRLFSILYPKTLKAACETAQAVCVSVTREKKTEYIKEVKKYTGELPKDLSKNECDRFLQFSVIRVLMIVIPVILAVVSFLIYKKCYKLKGAAMEEVTEKVNEIHAQRKIVTE